MIVRFADVHITNCEGMCLLVMYQSFVDTCSEHHADSRTSVKQVVGGSSDAQDPCGMPVVCGGGNFVVQLESKDAAVNVQIPKFVKMYNLVQACCEPKNLLKRPSKHNDDFNIIEITEKDDFRSPAGRLIATQALRGPHDTLFFAAPCTGGSKWTTINRHMNGERREPRSTSMSFSFGNCGILS